MGLHAEGLQVLLSVYRLVKVQHCQHVMAATQTHNLLLALALELRNGLMCPDVPVCLGKSILLVQQTGATLIHSLA